MSPRDIRNLAASVRQRLFNVPNSAETTSKFSSHVMLSKDFCTGSASRLIRASSF
jgi:chemotaxis regulatin CheY-phosphate phosphatase CheZ